MNTGLYNPKDGIILNSKKDSVIVDSGVGREGSKEGEGKRIEYVKMEIKEILPIEHETKTTGRQVNYARTKVELVTLETLRQMYQSIAREEVKIMDTPKFYIIQYGNKPPILVNKENGRLYYIDGLGYDKGQIEHQAATLLNIWYRRGLVEGYQRTRIILQKGGKLENTEKFISEKNTL